jgi:hypothetical protein
MTININVIKFTIDTLFIFFLNLLLIL